jgi:hypothetical protein
MSSLENLSREVISAFETAGIHVAVIGVDFSFNEDREEQWHPHWLIHVRAIVPQLLSHSAIKRLRAEFPKSSSIPRPCRHAVFDGDPRGIAYSMKPSFGRRQSYPQRKVTAEGTRRCRNTRGRPLTGKQALELALYLDRIGLRRRLILHGARLARLGGTVVIVTRPGSKCAK